MGRRRCCCETWPCVLGLDGFNRPDNADLGPNWEEHGSANWQIKDHALYSPGGAGTVIAAFDHDYRRRGYWILISAVLDEIEHGAVYRVVFDYVDDDNYVYVDCRINPAPKKTGKIYIGIRQNGVDTDRFWNGIDVDISAPNSFWECGYEPEGNGVIWVETGDSSGAGGARLLPSPFDPAEMEIGKTCGIANVGGQSITIEDFLYEATFDSDGRKCVGLCGCDVMKNGRDHYIQGLPRVLLATFWEKDGCPEIDGNSALLYQIQSPNHPDWPDPIPETGLSYQLEWRTGWDRPCSTQTLLNWTLVCGSIEAGAHNNPPETLPNYALASTPDCFHGGVPGNHMYAVGPYDSTIGLECDAWPNDDSTCDPVYLRFTMQTWIESGDEECPPGLLPCCG